MILVGGAWTFLLATKSNEFSILKLFLAMIERQFNKKVRVIRSDNAWELGSSLETTICRLHKASFIKLLVLPHHNKMVWLRGNIGILRILLGKKGYKLFSLHSQKYFVSRNIVFL